MKVRVIFFGSLFVCLLKASCCYAQVMDSSILQLSYIDSSFYMADAISNETEELLLIRMRRPGSSLNRNRYLVINVRERKVLSEFELKRFVYFNRSYFCYKDQLLILNIGPMKNYLVEIETGILLTAIKVRKSPKGPNYYMDNNDYLIQLSENGRIKLKNGITIVFRPLLNSIVLIQ